MNWAKAHRNDILLALILLLTAGFLSLFLFLTRRVGGYVTVSLSGQTVMEVPLSEDTIVEIGDDGHTNTLTIQNGAAQITQASCPDHLCIHQGAIQYAGQSIVCLPNQVVVTVRHGSDGGFDAVAN